MPVRVIGPAEGCGPGVIDTTSRSKTWSRGLSPFLLGPVPLYEGAVTDKSVVMENAWVFSRVYANHLDPFSQDIKPEYYTWALEGWKDPRAQRHPMGRKVKPEFSLWAGEQLGYIEARKKIYIPLYTRVLVPSQAFQRLQELYRAEGRAILWDFDGYDHVALGMTFKDVVNNPDRPMGHAFVIAYLLEKMSGQ